MREQLLKKEQILMADNLQKPAFDGDMAAYTALGGAVYRASALTRGPWHPQQQHAGPPIALVSHALEAAAQAHGLHHLPKTYQT